MTFGILLGEGELAGVEHSLSLEATNTRRRLGLLVLDRGRIGPCYLVRTRIDAATTLWEFGQLEADGSMWTPHRALYGEYVPHPRDPIPEPV